MFAQDFCESAAMSSDPRAYATTVLAAFEQAGLYTDDEVKAAGGPSSSTMTKLRAAAAGHRALDEPRGDTHRRIDTAARWRLGSSRGLWRYGLEPSYPRSDMDTAAEVRRSNLSPGAKARILTLLEAEPDPLGQSVRQRFNDRGLAEHFESETVEDDKPASGSA